MHRDLWLEDLGEVPRDRLALPVLVSCEIELVDTGEELFEPLDPVFALFGDDIQGLEVVFHIDSETGPILALGLCRDLRGRARKVSNVTH